MTYSIRVLKNILPRKIHRQIIHSFFISKLMFGSQVWAGCINSIDSRKINTVLFKIMRVHCKDHGRTLRNSKLCELSNLRTFSSMRDVFDAVMLQKPHKHHHCITSNWIVIFLFQIPFKTIFFDYSLKRVGSTSFMNRANKISELIPFDWSDLTKGAFKWKMKLTTPNFIV